MDTTRQKALPVLPLPAVGTVYGTPEDTGTTKGTGTGEKKEADR